MKALILSTAVAVLSILPTSAATAGVFTLGGPMAVHCYDAAQARSATAAAIESCERSLAEEPLTDQDRAATLVNRGILYMLQAQFDVAERSYDAAARLDPASPDPWLNKAFIRLRQGRGEAALPLLEKALTLRPRREALAYYARGIAREQTGDLRLAYADLRQAAALEPSWALPAQELARYELRGRR
jgi:tetratricopeptide (TPR) repeat protein